MNAVRLRPRPENGEISFNQTKGGPRVGLPSRSTQGTTGLSVTGNSAESPASFRETEIAGCSAVWTGAPSGHPVTQRMHCASCRWLCSLPSPGAPLAGSQTDHARSRSSAAAADRLGCGSSPNSSGSNKANTRVRASQWRVCRSCSSPAVPMLNQYAIWPGPVHSTYSDKVPRVCQARICWNGYEDLSTFY